MSSTILTKAIGFSAAAITYLVVIATPLHAQTVNVAVLGKADDTVGQQFIYQLREAIRRSASMHFVPDEDQSGFQLNVVTLNPDSADGLNTRTIYSVTYTMTNLFANSKAPPMYLTSDVGFCGASVIPSCAQSILADLDNQITEVQEIFSKSENTNGDSSNGDDSSSQPPQK